MSIENEDILVTDYFYIRHITCSKFSFTYLYFFLFRNTNYFSLDTWEN